MGIRVQTVCLVILSSVAVAASLRFLAPVMIPFVLAVFFAVGLAPLVDFQRLRLHFPQGVALGTTLVMAFVLFFAMASLVSASVRELAANAQGYQARVMALAADAVHTLPLEALGIRDQAIVEPLRKFSVGTLGSLLLGTTNAVLDLVSRGVLVMIFMLFLMLGEGTGVAGHTYREIERQVQRFLVMKGTISAATGTLVGFTLWLLGVDLALVFGLFAFLLNFIPSIGSLVATLLPLPVVVASPDLTLTVAILAIVIPGAIQFLIGSVLEPKLMGDSLDIHPVAILLNLMLWGMLWGVVGMLLATPILVVMKILFERFEGTQGLAAVIAGRLDQFGTAGDA